MNILHIIFLFIQKNESFQNIIDIVLKLIELKSSISYLNCLHFYYNQDLFEKSFLDGLFGDYWLEEYFLISIIEKTYQIFDKLGIFLDNIYNLKLKKSVILKQ